MAKVKSIIKFSGSIKDVTFVNSKTYDPHIRAKRGTYTKVERNDSFAASSKDQTRANVPAKIIQDAIDPYRRDFRDGRLWNRLVSKFRKTANGDSSPDFTRLNGLELCESQPLSRHIQLGSICRVDDNGVLEISIKSRGLVVFREKKGIDEYELKLIVIFPQPEINTATTQLFEFPRLSVKKPFGLQQLALQIPDYAKAALLCVKLGGWSKGYLSASEKTKGMAIVDSARL